MEAKFMQYKSLINSQSLFHFTSSLSILKEIISSQKFLAKYCTEYCWNGYKFALPMACFCDIPMSQTICHMNNYGFYGIGMKSSWQNSKLLSSAIYVKSKSPIVDKIGKILNKINAKKESNAKKNAKDAEINRYHLYLLAHIKKYCGKQIYPNTENSRLTYFYQEREWRYVPKDFDINMLKVEHNDNKPIDVKPQTDFYLDFKPDDIRCFIIKEESERMELINSIDKLGYSKDELNLLKSKIITSKQILYDF